MLSFYYWIHFTSLCPDWVWLLGEHALLYRLIFMLAFPSYHAFGIWHSVGIALHLSCQIDGPCVCIGLQHGVTLWSYLGGLV